MADDFLVVVFVVDRIICDVNNPNSIFQFSICSLKQDFEWRSILGKPDRRFNGIDLKS